MHSKSFLIRVMILFPLLSFAKVSLITNKNGNEWTYIVKNAYACPIQVLFRYTNTTGNEEIIHHVIPAYSEQIVFSISNRTLPSFRFTYELGDPFLEPEDVEYWLPLPPGEFVRVTQGYHTRFSHKGKNAYSIDFALAIGTPVYAARDGVVVIVKDNSRRGGNRKAYRGMANYIVIYHSDGTFAHYVHLKYKGAVVKPGDRVEAGQLIGYSGNTGWTKGPHLHFMVTRAGYMDRFSIPTRFYSSEGPLTNLIARNFYLVEHPSSTVVLLPSTNTNSLAAEAMGEDEGDVGAP
ncbi:MAG: M23 family metallopeptidase [Brevinematales bacterium]|nr:M23 family metallopeptidase [Brevinematales bacterium]